MQSDCVLSTWISFIKASRGSSSTLAKAHRSNEPSTHLHRHQRKHSRDSSARWRCIVCRSKSPPQWLPAPLRWNSRPNRRELKKKKIYLWNFIFSRWKFPNVILIRLRAINSCRWRSVRRRRDGIDHFLPYASSGRRSGSRTHSIISRIPFYGSRASG